MTPINLVHIWGKSFDLRPHDIKKHKYLDPWIVSDIRLHSSTGLTDRGTRNGAKQRQTREHM